MRVTLAGRSHSRTFADRVLLAVGLTLVEPATNEGVHVDLVRPRKVETETVKGPPLRHPGREQIERVLLVPFPGP